MQYFILALVVLGAFSFVRLRRRSRELAEWRAQNPGGEGKGVGAPRAAVDDIGVTLTQGGTKQHVAWKDVRTVHIESVEGGLNADNVLWVLEPADGSAPLRIAQTAPGADLMIARLQQFPGFQYEPMIQSMITTEATRFLVWQK